MMMTTTMMMMMMMTMIMMIMMMMMMMMMTWAETWRRIWGGTKKIFRGRISGNMTISSQENHHFSLCSYFHAHPTTLLLKILGGPMHGPSPTSNFGGTVPQSHPRSPPLDDDTHLEKRIDAVKVF